MFERLPDWVSVACEWIMAIIMGMAGIFIALLFGWVIAYVIRLIVGKG